ncbi:alpha-L-iduronidase [Elysia marginata]|uniref:Alpha-L-iduronidase n=1 Tax=Elysia marginata TaxID=1093978 RepID=A0AAV4IEE0_9GAST|nr:alpha-L-iduronidase [Elysia marginata]
MASQQVTLSFLLSLIVGFSLIALHSSQGDKDGPFALSVVLNASDIRADFHHFWRSTGFCPPQPHNDASFDLSSDMAQNLAYIGALPFNGITQVRIHWLLDLIKVSRISSAGPVYNFKLLDSLVKLMHQNGLALGFELMGSPSGLFTDFENRTQVFWFRDLVSVLATRYIKKYSLDYVKKWNFETWNEPDCHDFDKIKFSVQGFLNYYDACSEGLEAAHSSLVLGGPGDACWPDPITGKLTKSRVLFDALLNHTIHGTNYFNGKKGIRLDFISLHEKGDAQGLKILEREIDASKYINSKYPELANKPFYNDEADLLVGWSQPKEWRGTSEYAALIMKFTQRTLLARFQMNSTLSEEEHDKRDKVSVDQDTKSKLVKQSYTTFVRKPAYILMGMLPLLGEKQVYLNITKYFTNEVLSNSSDFGVLGTVHLPEETTKSSDSWQVTFLAYGASDPGTNKTKAFLDLKWYLNPPKDVKDLKLMMYTIYMKWGDPYVLWKLHLNSTTFPTLDDFAQLREMENPGGNLIDVPVRQGFAPIPPAFELEDPYIAIMHVCARPPVGPEKVVGVRLLNITAGQVMVVWSDENIRTKCILTYSVEWSPSNPNGPFIRINTYNIIVNVFIYETDSDKKVQGFYRVRAVDYWERKSSASDVVTYTDPA